MTAERLAKAICTGAEAENDTDIRYIIDRVVGGLCCVLDDGRDWTDEEKQFAGELIECMSKYSEQ